LRENMRKDGAPAINETHSAYSPIPGPQMRGTGGTRTQ
jgi:hypothetical protein